MVTSLAYLLASAVLLGTGIFVPSLWFLSIIGCVPLAHALTRISREGNVRVFLAGWFFGTAFTGATIFWFWHTLPLDWLGLESPVIAVAFVGIYWASVALACGFLFGVFALLFLRWKRGTLLDAVLAASLWTLLQYAQMWWFSFITIGTASLIGAHFSTFLVGYALAWFSPLLQLAYFGGPYALTFAVVVLGFLLYGGIRTRTPQGAVAGIVFCAFAASVFTYVDRNYDVTQKLRHSDPKDTIALVTTDFPAAAKDDDEKRRRGFSQDDSIRSWARHNPAPALLVLPEAAEFFKTTGQDPAEFARDVFDNRTAIIDSAPFTDDRGRKSVRVFTYDQNGALHGAYDKMFLVPQGEYSPYLYSFLPRLFGGKDFAERIASFHSLKRGSGVEVLDFGSLKFGSLFCADVLSPILYRQLTQAGAELLVNPASQSLFHGSSVVELHIIAMAKVRAVESDRFFAIAGNTISSVLISNTGMILAQSGGTGILSGSVEQRTTRTPYVRLGDYVLLVPVTILLWFAAVRREDQPVT